MTTDLSLKVTRRISASPEQAFDAWLTPATLQKFITPDPGFDAPDVSLDPREGGRFDILMKSGDTELPHWGIYKEIRRPERLVFTWASEYSFEDSIVVLTFEPEGSGTRVTLTHDRFRNEEMRENHEKGWTAILDSLDAAA